jgi:putative endonuclease
MAAARFLFILGLVLRVPSAGYGISDAGYSVVRWTNVFCQELAGNWRSSVRACAGKLRLLVFAPEWDVARNYVPRGAEGEIDRIGYDGKTLALVEVRTVSDAKTALPELSVTTDKQRFVIRTARRFLSERHVGNCPCRFNVLAIDNWPSMTPEVRLHKDAFSPQM